MAKGKEKMGKDIDVLKFTSQEIPGYIPVNLGSAPAVP